MMKSALLALLVLLATVAGCSSSSSGPPGEAAPKAVSELTAKVIGKTHSVALLGERLPQMLPEINALTEVSGPIKSSSRFALSVVHPGDATAPTAKFSKAHFEWLVVGERATVNIGFDFGEASDGWELMHLTIDKKDVPLQVLATVKSPPLP